MNLKKVFSDKIFFKTMLKLAIPIATQNLILSSLNLVDNIVVGGLGATAIASVGLANQYFFLLNLFLFGIMSGGSIFTAQYWGNKDIKGIKRVLGLSIISGGIMALIFTIGGLLFPRQIIDLFSNDAAVIEMGGRFLRIIALSYVITAVTFAFSFTLRSIRQVKAPMIVSITALSINTILNYVLVYGLFGAPALGIEGSAIATVIARTIECLLIITIVYKKELVINAHMHELLDLSSQFIKRFFKVTSPVIANEGLWALGVTIYAWVYGQMGTDVVAATNITSTIERMVWVIFLGLGNAAAVMIGNKLGERDNETAFDYAMRFIIVNPLLGVAAGLVIFFGSGPMLSLYKIDPIVRDFSSKLFMVHSCLFWLRVFNYTNIVGILRSGGDTKFCLLLDVGGMWLVGVPLVALAGLVWHLPIYIVFIFVYMEEFAKFIIGLPRISSKKWINNLASGS